MKKLLILIVGFALFLHFYPQPELDKWYSGQKDDALDGFSDTFGTEAKRKTDVILIDLKEDMKSFTTKERAQLEEIADSRRLMKAFYSDYCLAKKRQFKMRAGVQAKICKTISKHPRLL